MASAGRPRGFGSDPPTGLGRAGLGGRQYINLQKKKGFRQRNVDHLSDD